MEAAELEQRSFGDRFWGYDLEIVTRNMEMSSMRREEERCRANDAQLIAIEIQSTWQQEIKEEEYSDSFVKALEQVQERRRYLKSVFSTDTSQQIIDYQWSTRIKIRPPSFDSIIESSSSKKSKRIKSMETVRSIANSTDSAMMRYCMSGVSCLRLSRCINALNCCVHYLYLRSWVYVLYVQYIEKIMKLFSML
jgi:hypothetical protein